MTTNDRSSLHGYSGKPLFLKLGLEPGMRCLPLNAPSDYRPMLQGAHGVEFVEPPDIADLVHLFCLRRSVLEDQVGDALSCVEAGGMLWVSWPKKSSGKFVDLTEDGVRAVVLRTGWVDVKVCAVDQDWSGLKFLHRRT